MHDRKDGRGVIFHVQGHLGRTWSGGAGKLRRNPLKDRRRVNKIVRCDRCLSFRLPLVRMGGGEPKTAGAVTARCSQGRWEAVARMAVLRRNRGGPREIERCVKCPIFCVRLVGGVDTNTAHAMRRPDEVSGVCTVRVSAGGRAELRRLSGCPSEAAGPRSGGGCAAVLS